MFDCPSCGATGKGVLLLVSVAPCDDCFNKQKQCEKNIEKFEDKKEAFFIFAKHNQIDTIKIASIFEIESIFLYASSDFISAKKLTDDLNYFPHEANNLLFRFINLHRKEINEAIINEPETFCVIKFIKV
jgi:hypothetical protein